MDTSVGCLARVGCGNKKFHSIKILLVLWVACFAPEIFPQSGTSHFENRKQKGYFNLTQISLLMGNRKLSDPSNNFNGNVRNDMLVSPSVTMTNGGIINEHWAIGFGMGFEIFKHNLTPVFADVRYTLWNNVVSPFFSFKMGYAIGNLRKKHYDELYLPYQPFQATNVYFRNRGGFMLHPEMGFMVSLSERADLLFSVAYRHQKMKTAVSEQFGWRYKWEHKENMNRLSFGLAIMFR